MNSDASAEVPDDVANRMSLFYANPTPMLNTLSGGTEKLLQEVCVCACAYICEHVCDNFVELCKHIHHVCLVSFQNPALTLENTTDCFCTMACVCRVLNENP